METLSKTWYITGASKGLGLSTVKFLLKMGQRVAATSRNMQELTSAIDFKDNAFFLPLKVDLTDELSIEQSLAATHKHFGRLDVILNNAGYGITGTIEELTLTEIIQSIDVNLLASIRVIHFAMPYLRAQGFGHIINIAFRMADVYRLEICSHGIYRSSSQ